MPEFIVFTENFLSSSVWYAVPIVFAATAALISNKAGTLSINIEGSMSVAALAAAMVSHYSGSFMLGLLAALAAGVGMSMLLAFAAQYLKTDGVLSGIALNMLATGLTIYVLYVVLGVKGDSSTAPSTVVPNLHIPYISDIPIIGSIFFSQNALTYIAVAAVVAVSVLLKRTKLGMHIKAAGYNPAVARSVGIRVGRIRTYSLIMCGVFAGLGGAVLSQAYLSYFSAGMVSGRGFIGIAAEAMGGGMPYFTLLFAFLFGMVDYFSVAAQSMLNLPYELLNTLPYVMTILALVAYALIKKYKKPKLYKSGRPKARNKTEKPLQAVDKDGNKNF
jgi:simple sugar transport system permease protein